LTSVVLTFFGGFFFSLFNTTGAPSNFLKKIENNTSKTTQILLYNMSTRTFYIGYTPKGKPALNILPNVWPDKSKKGTSKFPAQLRVECLSLPLKQIQLTTKEVSNTFKRVGPISFAKLPKRVQQVLLEQQEPKTPVVAAVAEHSTNATKTTALKKQARARAAANSNKAKLNTTSTADEMVPLFSSTGTALARARAAANSNKAKLNTTSKAGEMVPLFSSTGTALARARAAANSNKKRVTIKTKIVTVKTKVVTVKTNQNALLLDMQEQLAMEQAKSKRLDELVLAKQKRKKMRQDQKMAKEKAKMKQRAERLKLRQNGGSVRQNGGLLASSSASSELNSTSKEFVPSEFVFPNIDPSTGKKYPMGKYVKLRRTALRAHEQVVAARQRREQSLGFVPQSKLKLSMDLKRLFEHGNINEVQFVNALQKASLPVDPNMLRRVQHGTQHLDDHHWGHQQHLQEQQDQYDQMQLLQQQHKHEMLKLETLKKQKAQQEQQEQKKQKKQKAQEQKKQAELKMKEQQRHEQQKLAYPELKQMNTALKEQERMESQRIKQFKVRLENERKQKQQQKQLQLQQEKEQEIFQMNQIQAKAQKLTKQRQEIDRQHKQRTKRMKQVLKEWYRIAMVPSVRKKRLKKKKRLKLKLMEEEQQAWQKREQEKNIQQSRATARNNAWVLSSSIEDAKEEERKERDAKAALLQQQKQKRQQFWMNERAALLHDVELLCEMCIYEFCEMMYVSVVCGGAWW